MCCVLCSGAVTFEREKKGLEEDFQTVRICNQRLYLFEKGNPIKNQWSEF